MRYLLKHMPPQIYKALEYISKLNEKHTEYWAKQEKLNA